MLLIINRRYSQGWLLKRNWSSYISNTAIKVCHVPLLLCHGAHLCRSHSRVITPSQLPVATQQRAPKSSSLFLSPIVTTSPSYSSRSPSRSSRHHELMAPPLPQQHRQKQHPRSTSHSPSRSRVKKETNHLRHSAEDSVRQAVLQRLGIKKPIQPHPFIHWQQTINITFICQIPKKDSIIKNNHRDEQLLAMLNQLHSSYVHILLQLFYIQVYAAEPIYHCHSKVIPSNSKRCLFLRKMNPNWGPIAVHSYRGYCNFAMFQLQDSPMVNNDAIFQCIW